MKYLKEYATQAEYIADRDNIDIPNVILIDENEDDVIFGDYLEFEDPEVWRICCINWGDYTEVVVTDNGDNTVNITRTPVRMKNTTAKSGTSVVEENIDNTPDASGNTPYEVGTTKEPIGITKWQCEAVKSVGTVFRSNKNISTFDEFKYFTSVTSLSDNAFRETSITRITLSDNLTTLLSNCFYSCASLVHINLSHVISIGGLCFYNCTALTSVDISNCVTLGGAFRGCTSLTDVGSLDSIVNLTGTNHFEKTKISGSIIFTEFTGTTIPASLFDWTTLVTSASFPKSQYTSIGARAFGWSGIKEFTVREGCTTLNNHSFSSGNLEFIDLPSTLTTWNGFTLWQNTKQKVIVCRPTTPPTVGNTTGTQQSFDGIPSTCKVYVPSASISLYEATDGWSKLSGKYLPIEGSIYEH